MKCCQLVYSCVNGTFPFSPQCLRFLRSRMWDCSRKLETVWGPLGKTIVMAKVYRAASTDEPGILRRAQVRDPVLRESNIHNRHGIDLFTEVFQPHFPPETVLGVPWLFWHSSNVWLRQRPIRSVSVFRHHLGCEPSSAASRALVMWSHANHWVTSVYLTDLEFITDVREVPLWAAPEAWSCFVWPIKFVF